MKEEAFAELDSTTFCNSDKRHLMNMVDEEFAGWVPPEPPPIEIPPATKTSIGGIIVGEGIDCDAEGKISVATAPVPEPYVLPEASRDTLGGIRLGDLFYHDAEGYLCIRTNPQDLTINKDTTLGRDELALKAPNLISLAKRTEAQLYLLRGVEHLDSPDGIPYYRYTKSPVESTLEIVFQLSVPGWVSLELQVNRADTSPTSFYKTPFSKTQKIDVAFHSADRSQVWWHKTYAQSSVLEFDTSEHPEGIITIQIAQVPSINAVDGGTEYLPIDDNMDLLVKRHSQKEYLVDSRTSARIPMASDVYSPPLISDSIPLHDGQFGIVEMPGIHPRCFNFKVAGGFWDDYISGNPSYLGWTKEITTNQDFYIGLKSRITCPELADYIGQEVAIQLLFYAKELISFPQFRVSKKKLGHEETPLSEEITVSGDGVTFTAVLRFILAEEWTQEDYFIHVTPTSGTIGISNAMIVDPSTSPVATTKQYVDGMLREVSFAPNEYNDFGKYD